jgi:hypothetical protein
MEYWNIGRMEYWNDGILEMEEEWLEDSECKGLLFSGMKRKSSC